MVRQSKKEKWMIKTIRLIGCFTLIISTVLFFGCAFNLTDVKYQLARIESVSGELTSFTIDVDTPIHGAPCGYSRSLRKGTKWEPIGRLAEGIVYRSRDQVLTIECSNIFEVYLVVVEQRLVGFYLPVEKAFSPLSENIKLVVSNKP
jgi:hypothetical protein